VRYVAALVAVVLAGGALAACDASEDEASRPAPGTTAVGRTEGAELPVPRTEVAGAVLDDDTIVVAGGFLADGTASARVDVYHRDDDRWTEGPSLPEPRHHAAMASSGGRVWVVGGIGATGEAATVWSLGPGERAWRAEPPLLAPRGALGLAATGGGTLVAFGGTSAGAFLASTELLEPGATQWRPGPPMGEPREHVAAMSFGGRVFAVAGRVGSLSSNKATVESLDADADVASWRAEPPLTKARGGTAAAAGCVAGGEEDAGTIAPVECLRDGRWEVVAQLRRSRHGLAVVALGDDLHVIGGGERPGLFVSGAHEVLSGIL